MKNQELFGKSRKHCGKRRKCWLPAFSLLTKMFSQACYFRVVKLGIVWLRVKELEENDFDRIKEIDKISLICFISQLLFL